MVGVEVHILRRAVKGVAVFTHRVQPDFIKIDAALSDISLHFVPQNLICREQVHRRHESGVCFVLLPDGFLEGGLVLLAFESHLVNHSPKIFVSKQKSRLFFLSDADQTSFFKTIGFRRLYTKKRTDFLLARLIGWVLNFLEIGGSEAHKMLSQEFTFKNTPKMPNVIYGTTLVFIDP